MVARSSRKYFKALGKEVSFKDRVATGQWLRKLERSEAKMEDVPEFIRAMIAVDKPQPEVVLEVAADNVLDAAEQHIHSDSCNHS